MNPEGAEVSLVTDKTASLVLLQYHLSVIYEAVVAVKVTAAPAFLWSIRISPLIIRLTMPTRGAVACTELSGNVMPSPLYAVVI